MKSLTFISLLTTFLFKNINADSICGSGSRFMIALTCGDGSTTLYCAPNNLKDRSQFCQNPNDKWAKAKCNNKGGLVSVDIANSGCYLESLCLTCEINVPKLNPINAGFESGDLTGWTSSGPTPAVVLCDGSSPEGTCYAKLTTSGTYSSSEPNVLSNSNLLIPNYGGCNNYNHVLTFWYRFDANDYLPYNDYLTVDVKDSSNNVVFTQTLDVASLGDYVDSGWQFASVLLGSPPAGSAIHLTLSAKTEDVLDGNLPSDSYIDGLQLLKV